MYNGIIALNKPVHIPIKNLPIIIVGPTFMKQMAKLKIASILVNKKHFLNSYKIYTFDSVF